MLNKNLLIIGAGILQEPCIRTAKEMGLNTVVFDGNPDAPGMRIADVPVVASTRDVDGIVSKAREINRKYKLQGAITVGTDASVAVSVVTNEFGLPGIKYEDAVVATDKLKMRQRLKEHGVGIPDFGEVRNIEDAKKHASRFGFPLVLKPSYNMGARGVIKIEREEDIEKAYAHAERWAGGRSMIIEQYMDGPEFSVDVLSYNGRIEFCGIADRIIGYPPYFVELGHIMPTDFPKEDVDKVRDITARAIKALNITWGAGKGDIKLTKRGAMVGEMAARLSGGFMSAYTYPLSTGVNLIKAGIELALGQEPSDLTPKFNRVSAEKAIIPKPGRVKSISGYEEARKIEGIALVSIRTKVGDVFGSPTSNVEKAGNVISVADKREQALELCDRVLKMIKIETE